MAVGVYCSTLFSRQHILIYTGGLSLNYLEARRFSHHPGPVLISDSSQRTQLSRSIKGMRRPFARVVISRRCRIITNATYHTGKMESHRAKQMMRELVVLELSVTAGGLKHNHMNVMLYIDCFLFGEKFTILVLHWEH